MMQLMHKGKGPLESFGLIRNQIPVRRRVGDVIIGQYLHHVFVAVGQIESDSGLQMSCDLGQSRLELEETRMQELHAKRRS